MFHLPDELHDDYVDQRPDVFLHRFLEDAVREANPDGSLRRGAYDGACMLFAKTLGLSHIKRPFDVRKLFWSSSRGKPWSPTLTRVLQQPAYFTMHKQPAVIVAHPCRSTTTWDCTELVERYEIEVSVLKVPSWHRPRRAVALALALPGIVPGSMCVGQWRPTLAPMGELH